MASVTSLGLHQPTGLRHAIAEGILPPNPPPALYTWEVSVDREGDSEYLDELLTTQTSVIWSRGGLFRKSFTSSIENEPVTQALLAYFPASADSNDTTPDDHSPSTRKDAPKKAPAAALSRALVVFLKTQAHIFFLSGASHIVHMPFEVESACAAPCGVIIQRKSRGSNAAPMSLRIPKVPPNSFVSSQLSPFAAPRVNVTEFSTEALGKPKTLPLRLSSTLETMWHAQVPLDVPDSHWPRLVCLTDPLLEIGLVVTQTGAPRKQGRRRSSTGSLFLNPAEEILHVQEIKLGADTEAGKRTLNIAVTVNREINMYSVWRLAYLEHEDPFIGKQKQKKPNASRRRSSMAPGLASGTATPMHPSMRESFGAPLPGKRTRKSVRIEENEKILDKALSSLDPEKGADATRRESRRVSSLLARGDLSTSQDRSTFVDQSMHPTHGSRRVESHGSQRGRVSGGYNLPSFSGTFNQNLNSLAEAPVDNLLEELRAGGDFEGFHNMGLEDHDFEGLTQEMLFTKIYSIPIDNANVRYSLSTLPARTQSKVFMLVGPPTATDLQGRTSILVGIQDPVDKRLQLLTLLVENQPAGRSKPAQDADSINVVFGELRRVQSVVDSCKISDGDESGDSMIILSEDRAGGRELSLQSPWGKVTKLAIPFLFFDNLTSLDYTGSLRTDKETRNRRSIGAGITGTQLDSLCHSQPRGVLDLRDRDGKYHRVRVKLRPSSHQVSRAIDVCRSVLPADLAEKFLTGWWQVTQWLQSAKLGSSVQLSVDNEWSSFVILVLSSFLALESPSGDLRRTRARSAGHSLPKSSWEAMQAFTAPNSSACSPWVRRKGWLWMLEDGLLEAPCSPGVYQPKPSSFMAIHTNLARKYLASAEGVAAFGPLGYLPTAVNRDQEGRNMAAWSIVMGLHLLVEEQRLTILTPEDSQPNCTDLRGLLCQLAKWLKWPKFQAVYAFGMETAPDTVDDSGTHSLPLPLTRSLTMCSNIAKYQPR
jgi:anaphase-promoting complex subunit 1